MADEDLVIDEARAGMEKSLDSLGRDFAKIRTGRANPSLLEGIQVDYFGTPTPLKSLATLNAPEARLLTVQAFDPGAIGEIERAILKSDLGLSPINDGKILRVPVPELTEERRRELVKQVKKLAEEHKVGVRSSRRDSVSMIKEMEKDGEVAKDDSRRVQKLIQDLTDAYAKKIDDAAAAKSAEVLTI